MSTQALLDKIKAASDESIKAIAADAENAVERIAAEAEASVAQIVTEATAAAEKAATAVERATLAKARQTGKLKVQAAKRVAFDAIMDAAKTTTVGDDAKKAQAWSDKQAELEMTLARSL